LALKYGATGRKTAM
jgi:hypothetical protein